ncbi:hypothetical protein [Archangium lansingense]|uniref:Uncharacterized protein n=1 Tax=Archangium lansingense TaxID=2995310 RepID=A0ABT4A3Z9_9BACT|nr:hypothetical protein [Archangium lansinium]MCY1075994.1 hypothetical protein [Archangium lansinium]
MKKEPESSGEELEQLGPYQLHEQVPQDELRHGELYRATHETSGATALVFKPAEGDGVPLPGDWRVRCVSSTSPGYVALEVEDSRWAVAPDKHSVEALMCLFESVREGVGWMSAAFPSSDEPRPWRRMGLALAVAAVLMVALLPAALAPVAEGRGREEAAEEVWATDVNVDPVPVRSGEAPRPRKNQKGAPCTEGLEVEVSGACWLPIEKRPCPPQTVAYQGQCLLPVAVPRPPVTSLDGGDGSVPR